MPFAKVYTAILCLVRFASKGQRPRAALADCRGHCLAAAIAIPRGIRPRVAAVGCEKCPISLRRGEGRFGWSFVPRGRLRHMLRNQPGSWSSCRTRVASGGAWAVQSVRFRSGIRVRFGRFLFCPRTRTIPTPRWHGIHPDRDGLGTLTGSLISCRPFQNPKQKQHKRRYDPISQTAQPRPLSTKRTRAETAEASPAKDCRDFLDPRKSAKSAAKYLFLAADCADFRGFPNRQIE